MTRWTLSLLTLALLIVWPLSPPLWAEWTLGADPTFWACFLDGGLALGTSMDNHDHDFVLRADVLHHTPYELALWPELWVSRGNYQTTGLFLPLWLLALAGAILAALSWHRHLCQHHRARRGCCPTCGYDLTGLPRAEDEDAAPTCPECGA